MKWKSKNTDVDWSFIRSLEGFERKGYVPQDTDGPVQSGVTVAMGFDLGQQTQTSIAKYEFSLPLLKKLLFYVGVKGSQAKGKLKQIALNLTDAELIELDEKVREVYYSLIEKEYNDNSDFSFSFLDGKKQTVIVSVAYQYGSLKKRCPKFFEAVTKGLWKVAASELDDFGDAYPIRRKKEAALLRSSLQE